MKRKKNTVYLPLTHALAWIVASTLLVSGSSYTLLKRYVKNRGHSDQQIALRSHRSDRSAERSAQNRISRRTAREFPQIVLTTLNGSI